MKTVIIGGVAGGATAGARLRRLDEEAEIIILERSANVSYANCGLPYYIGGVIQDKKALTLQTPESFRARFNIDVRVRNEVTAIDIKAKTVKIIRLVDGSEYTETYDKLILSPGAKPIRPTMPGIENERVMTLRTVEDALKIRGFIDKHKPSTAVVVGGGFIGLEAAENLIGLGIDTTLLQLDDQVLPPLDYDMACEVHTYLRSRGLKLCLGKTVKGFEANENGLSVLIKGKAPVFADFVIMAVGVAPDTELARNAGIALGAKGSIVVNERMETSVPDIYAVGDAVETKNLVTQQTALVPLAGPANKQGRIAADNICGKGSRYSGTQGSSVIKLFDMTVATTGINEKTAKQAGVSYDKVLTYSASHAGYYPGGRNMSIKTLFDPDSGKILGAQIVGFDGVDKRIDVLATAIRTGMTSEELTELELAYAPPFSSAKDPVNMVGYVIENIRDHLVKQYHWHDIERVCTSGATMLDTRTSSEYAEGRIPGTVNIPLHELRDRLGEIDKSKPVYVNCFSGQRSYIACRILSQNGFDCYNLSGGFRFYAIVAQNAQYDENPVAPCGMKIER